nr:DNA-directed DNA polymerase [Tanacetum cinerariifolium]
MADNRTMAQILQAPIEGYEDAVVVPKQDPHNHLSFFNKVTSTFRHPEVPNTTVKLLLFPFSLEGEARIWLDKEPPRSILTWENLVSMFINQFFPPSKTTYLRNEITNFLQKSNETFNEAWERFKDLLRQCPHHGFSELHQLDTFYNTLTPNDQDAVDSAAGGNFLDKIPRECLSIIESKSKVRYSRSRVTDVRANANAPLPSSSHSNSFDLHQIAASLEDKLDIRMNRFEKSLNEMKNSFITPTTPLKAVAEDGGKVTWGGRARVYGTVPVCVCAQEIAGASIAEDDFVKVGKFHFLSDFVVVDYVVDPRVPLILGRPFLRTGRALIDVYGEELTLCVDDETITFKVGQTLKYSYNDVKSINRIDVIDIDYIRLLKELLNKDPSSSPLPLKELNVEEIKIVKSSIDEPPELKLKELPSYLEYVFLEWTDKLPVVISKELKDEEKSALLKVLKSHKWAIAWKISDIKGIDPRFCTHKILMEDDFKAAVQHQRRVNPKIHEVIKKEVIKLFDAGLIYPIFDSPWVSPVHCVSKRVVLERLAGNELYCFLDGFSGYFQIPIDPQDQEKATFTCPYGTFAYRRIPFGLCNALGTFQRCMMAIFHDMIEKTM